MPQGLPSVIPGEVIASAHINSVADRVVGRFGTTAERDAAIPSPAAGHTCTVAGRLLTFDGATWVGVPRHFLGTDTPNQAITGGTPVSVHSEPVPFAGRLIALSVYFDLTNSNAQNANPAIQVVVNPAGTTVLAGRDTSPTSGPGVTVGATVSAMSVTPNVTVGDLIDIQIGAASGGGNFTVSTVRWSGLIA